MVTVFAQLVPSREASFSQVILNGMIITLFVSVALTLLSIAPEEVSTPTAVAVTMFSVLSQRVTPETMHEALEPAVPLSVSLFVKVQPKDARSTGMPPG
jgi:hypothetical protein